MAVRDQSELVIGPSNGWLAAKISPNIETQGRILSASGASAIEIVWNDDRIKALLEGGLDIDSFVYRSLHLGSFSDFDAVLTPAQQELLKTISRIAEQYSIHGTSLHPDCTPGNVYKLLLDHSIPAAIENMDRCKDTGRHVEEIELLVSTHKTPGVIDLQHCYEIATDKNLSVEDLAVAFAEVMLRNGGITHLHVSGEVTRGDKQVLNHAQLTIATNKDAILRALRAVFDYSGKSFPIILEGDPLPEDEFIPAGVVVPKEVIAEKSNRATAAISQEIAVIKRHLSVIN